MVRNHVIEIFLELALPWVLLGGNGDPWSSGHLVIGNHVNESFFGFDVVKWAMELTVSN